MIGLIFVLFTRKQNTCFPHKTFTRIALLGSTSSRFTTNILDGLSLICHQLPQTSVENQVARAMESSAIHDVLAEVSMLVGDHRET